MSKHKFRTFLATWGNGQHGRLGHWPSTTSELFPRVVPGLKDVVQVACGGAHTAAVTADGGLYTFGLNTNGQLGHSPDFKFTGEPLEVVLPDRITAVAAGESHTLALSDAGEVWSAGSNNDGQLGLGQQMGIKNCEFRLVRALQGVKVVELAAGQAHSLALSQSGQLYAWGHGGYGQLGLGPANTRWEWVPMVVRALQGVAVRSIAAGAYHSGCVDEEGSAYTWGHGGWWQLGLGISTHECLPQELQQPRLLSRLCLGFSHSLAIGRFGQVFSWGTDEAGSLGQGLKWPRPPCRTPERLKLDLTGGAAGWRHSAGVDERGALHAWGWGGAAGGGGLLNPNYDLGGGQLGLGDDGDVHEPARVQRLLFGRNRFHDLRQAGRGGCWRGRQVSCGRNHTAAVVEADLTDWELG